MQFCLNVLRERLAEKEYQRRVTLSDLRDALFEESRALPSQRFVIRHRRECLEQGLAAIDVELATMRAEFQRAEAEVSGRQLAIENLSNALRAGGAYDCAIVVAAERYRAHPDFASLKSEYEAALRDREHAAATVEQLRREIAALEG